MYCNICKQFFQPTQDEEKLIVAGALEETCTACAAKEWSEKNKNKELPALGYNYINRIRGHRLYRVDWFSCGGEHTKAFISLPNIIHYNTRNPITPKRINELHVTIISHTSTTSQRTTTEPKLTLTTNLENFKSRNYPVLWFQKLPDFYDSMTGVGRIQVPAQNVLSITRLPSQDTITLANDESLRLLYR